MIGRNDPCSCGSGKKYKRCCGPPSEDSVKNIRTPDFTSSLSPESFKGAFGEGDLPEGMPASFQDPQFLMQATQALQRLPRGQLQKFQSLMQKAMSGKDVTAEAAELEKALPADFKSLMQSWSGAGAESMLPQTPELPKPGATEPTPEMTVDQARKVVEDAVRQGALTSEQAASLLGPSAPVDPSLEIPAPQAERGISQFWKKLTRSQTK